jgi:hypothetical protein
MIETVGDLDESGKWKVEVTGPKVSKRECVSDGLYICVYVSIRPGNEWVVYSNTDIHSIVVPSCGGSEAA